jgi:predicted amidohydrolase
MRVTSIQLEITGAPKSEILRHVLEQLDRAPESDLILLPEVWNCGYFSFDRYRSESESMDGATVGAMREKAAQLSSHLLMGSFIEADGADLFNTTVLLDPNGEIAARYRKMHLFGYQSEESRLLTRGEEVVVAETPWGPAGLSTCYDLRFPELYRNMVDRGAVMFLVVSAWPHARTDAWRLFNRARAHENLAYLLSCNCAGTNAGTRYAGRSMFVDPLGAVLAEGGTDECFVSAEVDVAMVESVRDDFPALADRILR